MRNIPQTDFVARRTPFYIPGWKAATELIEALRELHRYRHLLRAWTVRQIKVRYKQSLLGGLWAIVQPLSITIVFSIIFSFFVKVPTGGVPYIIFYYSGLLPWTFFATSVTMGANSLVSNPNIITKIYCPREILPLSAVFATLLDFLVASLVYVALGFIYQISVGPSLILLPFLVIIQFFFTASVALVLAALNVFYRDIRFVVPLALQIYMYATPLIYPVSTLPQSIRPFYMLNPMASLLHSYRLILVYNTWPDPVHLGSALLITIVVTLASYAFFTKAAKKFADLI